MEVQEIRYFLALSETLNFTRAAERCNVTQPALTRAIKALEDKLGGGSLIHRERGNTHLTELGRVMKPYFEHMMLEMESAREKARAFGKLKDAKLTLGLMCTIGPTRMIDFFSSFTANNAGIELYLKDASATALEELLLKGEIDVAIYCKPDAIDERFHALPLYQERFMVGLGPDHPLVGRNAISFDEMLRHTYLSRSNCEFGQRLQALARERGIDIRFRYRSERDDWIQSMVTAGVGLTTIFEYAVTVPGLLTVPLIDPEMHRSCALVTVRGRPHSPAVGAFVHAAKRYPWTERMPTSAPGRTA